MFCFPGVELHGMMALKFSQGEIGQKLRLLLLLTCTLKNNVQWPAPWGHFLILVRNSYQEHRTSAAWYISATSLPFPSFQMCRCFSVAVCVEFLSGALCVAYVAVKHRFKFSLNCCLSVSGIKSLLVLTLQVVSSVLQQEQEDSLSLKSF